MKNIIYPAIEKYIEKLCDVEPLPIKALNDYTQENIHGSHMISGHYQGRFLSLFSKMIAPKFILEIGTYTGYSALCLSEGLKKGGQLTSLERDKKLAHLHEKFLKQHPQIKIIYGDALDIIPTLAETFDLVFIDADKVNYSRYFDLIIDKIRPGGIIISDNILWRGRITEKIKAEDKHSKIIQAIDNFNEKLHQDPRVEHIILPVRDGISITRKITPSVY